MMFFHIKIINFRKRRYSTFEVMKCSSISSANIFKYYKYQVRCVQTKFVYSEVFRSSSKFQKNNKLFVKYSIQINQIIRESLHRLLYPRTINYTFLPCTILSMLIQYIWIFLCVHTHDIHLLVGKKIFAIQEGFININHHKVVEYTPYKLNYKGKYTREHGESS